MAQQSKRLYIGPRLRRIRRDLGLTQAQMAADLEVSASYVTLIERNQRPLPADLMVWWPGPLFETRCATGWFQMLVPNRPKVCEAFGRDDRAGPSWAEGKVDPAGDYAWTLWRPYRCCRVRGQVLLSVIQWLQWPFCL